MKNIYSTELLNTIKYVCDKIDPSDTRKQLIQSYVAVAKEFLAMEKYPIQQENIYAYEVPNIKDGYKDCFTVRIDKLNNAGEITKIDIKRTTTKNYKVTELQIEQCDGDSLRPQYVGALKTPLQTTHLKAVPYSVSEMCNPEENAFA